jgi:nucleotidyltransferase AbiEii toxin of type IV toxin-antitoxin system
MSAEPRQHSDYSPRQTDAARRVLVDLGQTLAAFYDCLVVVGGWVPDLLLAGAAEPHVGSIDVDLALDARKLGDGRYAELLRVLLATRRYRPGRKAFQLLVDVDIGDGGKPIEVEVEFLAPKEVKLKKNRPKLLEGFRVLQAEGCGAAFYAPEQVEVKGRMVRGAQNKVTLRVASLPDFLVMKAHAIGGRDKPKDSYDLCYCLDHFPGGIGQLARVWRERAMEPDVNKAVKILREKFGAVDAFGPGQVVEFLALENGEAAAMQTRRAFELVQSLLRELS